MSHDKEDHILLQYLYFCSSPLRDDYQLMRDYEELVRNPNVVSIGFHKPEVMMVGTTPVIVPYKGVNRLIGEMIIFLVRQKVDGYWQVDFRFWNVTNPIFSKEARFPSTKVAYLHPHILPDDDQKLIDCSNGRLCIQRGQFGVYQHIRKGEMHHAVARLIEILHVYPSGTPYCDIEHWPVWEKGDA